MAHGRGHEALKIHVFTPTGEPPDTSHTSTGLLAGDWDAYATLSTLLIVRSEGDVTTIESG